MSKKATWCNGLEDDIKQNFRKMSIPQMAKEYNVSEANINTFIKRHKLSTENIISTLIDSEVIFIYESLLTGERYKFPNNFCDTRYKYYITVLRYLINEKLQYSRQDICEIINTNFFKRYKLAGWLAISNLYIIDFINESFPEYDIKKWELKNSSVGTWDNRTDVDSATVWLKEKLKQDKDVNNINEAKHFGFDNLAKEYGLAGLAIACFNGSCVEMFEAVYDTKYIHDEFLLGSRTFQVNDVLDLSKLRHNNVIYEINTRYDDLDKVGKTLINDVVRFCEEECKFPVEKDMRSMDGYIARTQFLRYFKGGWTDIYLYISPVKEIKPVMYSCHECREEKPFDDTHFQRDLNSKFGLSKICTKCQSKYSYERNLNKRAKKYNIAEEDLNNPIAWYEAYMKYNLKQMPDFCYEEKNMIKLIRYIALNKLAIKDEYDIAVIFNTPTFKKYRMTTWSTKFESKVNMFKKCFPEFQFNSSNGERKYISDTVMETIIDNWINETGYTLNDILNMSLRENISLEMISMSNVYFSGCIEMIIWYTHKKGLKHPKYHRNIEVYDFLYVTDGYWDIKENRITRVKSYCEEECKESIKDVLGDTVKLKNWIHKYFGQKHITGITYLDKLPTIYHLLVEAYPEIVANHILFEWEWTQCNNSDRSFLINALREFVLYRMNDVIIDPKRDIPIYINNSYISEIEPKLNKHISKGRFKDYYEWCCLSFSEYAEFWTPQDFDACIAFDGQKCGSMQELMVYEFLKKDMGIRHIKNIGSKRMGKYAYKLGNEYEYNMFCPDFVIEFDNSGLKLDSPIIIEYYGMYDIGHKHERFMLYAKKTKAKNKFYNSLGNIEFIEIYPEDNKFNFKGVRSKIDKYYNILNKTKVS